MTSKPDAKIVLVDIDGTLADVSHRLHHINGPGRKDWKSFFKKMKDDPPVDIVVRWVRNLAPDYEVVIVSGRPDDYRTETEAWLESHGIRYSRLLMRRSGDRRPDYVVKQQLLSELDSARVAFVIDDRPTVCDMWRGCGLRVFQVSAGEAY